MCRTKLVWGPRHGDAGHARVLSRLDQRTGKGNRWSQARVATVRRKHHIAAAQAIDPDILNLAKAQKHTGAGVGGANIRTWRRNDGEPGRSSHFVRGPPRQRDHP